MKKLLKNKAGRDVLSTLDQQKYEKIKVSAISATLTTLVCAATVPTYASDIEIYTKPSSTAGSGVVVMMLDTSGSMDLSANNFGVGDSACDLAQGVSSNYYGEDIAPGGYSRRYCAVGGTKNIIITKNRAEGSVGMTAIFQEGIGIVMIVDLLPLLLMVVLQLKLIEMEECTIINLKVLRRIMTV